MVNFSGGTITMFRGDDVQLNLEIYINDVDLYLIQHTDEIKFFLLDKEKKLSNKTIFTLDFDIPEEGKTTYVTKTKLTSDKTMYLKNKEYEYKVILIHFDESNETKLRETVCCGRFFIEG